MYFHQIPVLEDNYIYLIINDENKEAICIDPAVADPVLQFLNEKKLKLIAILNTHHHPDHIGGNKKLKQLFNAHIYAPEKNKSQIQNADTWLSGGESLTIWKEEIQVLALPGHTLGHIAFYFKKLNWLFSGDTLFSMGCGRLFEGTPEMMWKSLKMIRSLPKETMIFCTHEYTLANLKFALHINHDNSALKDFLKVIKIKRENNEPTVPMTLKQEISLNPFLRADDPQFKKTLGLDSKTDVESFAYIRKLKDQF